VDADAGLLSADAGALADAGVTPDAGPPPTVLYAQVQQVWDTHCTSCHFYGGQLPNLLGPGSRERLLAETVTCSDGMDVEERPAVTPNNVEASALMHKLANVDFNCGREMPPTGTGGLIAIDRAAFDVVSLWIQQGAREQ